MLGKLFCNHYYEYLGFEKHQRDTEWAGSYEDTFYRLHVIYCSKCRKTIKDENKTVLDILVKKSIIDNIQ
jgi:hypothetical protein